MMMKLLKLGFFLILLSLEAAARPADASMESGFSAHPEFIRNQNATLCPECDFYEDDRLYYTAHSSAEKNNAQVRVSLLSEVEVRQLFSEINSRARINFAMVKDYCFARAHKIAFLMEDRTFLNKFILSGKIFVQGDFHGKINGKNEINWGYHVAAFVAVKTSAQGPQLFVLDPSLFDKPVAMNVWVDLLQKFSSTPLKPYLTNRFSYVLEDWPSQLTSYRQSDLDETDRILRKTTE